jgi:glycosyltransferase involved in cell wall biosynthesis
MRLGVVFTLGVSVEALRRSGLFSREMAVLEALGGRLGQAHLFTYDRAPVPAPAPHVVVHHATRVMPTAMYSILMPMVRYRHVTRVNVFRTVQANGVWTAVLAARLARRPLVFRMGFLWSRLLAAMGKPAWKQHTARWAERLGARAAAAVVVTTEGIRRAVIGRYRVDASRVVVVPNGIDTRRFSRADAYDAKGPVCFVGRLTEEKSLALVIDALVGLDRRLLVVGDGPQRPALEARAATAGVDARFVGTVPNDAVPDLLQRAGIFVFPSVSEGSPKAMLEAMACGVPVVTTPWEGADEFIGDGRGLVVDRRAAALRGAIGDLAHDPALAARVGEAGRAWVAATHSIDVAVAREAELLRRVAGQ